MTRSYSSVLALAARTASPTDVTLSVPPNAVALGLIIDVTAIAATPSITVTVNGTSPAGGTEYVILASAAITAVGVTELQIGPGFASTANASESAILPHELVISVAHADADSITYSIDAFFA